MASSGDRCVAVTAVAFAAAVVLSGCGGGARQPVAVPPSAEKPETSVSSGPAAASTTGCKVQATAAVTNSLKSGWARPWPGNVVPFASGAATGDTIVAAVHDEQHSGIALVSSTTGTVKRMIENYSLVSQATGTWDGRYAVWKESNTANDLDDFTVKEWDSARNVVTVIGGAHRGKGGAAIPSTWEDPALSHGRAAWVEGLDGNGAGEIVVANLRTEQRAVLRRGHPGWIALTPTSLIWAESPSPGAETTVRALDLASGKQTQPPAALAQTKGAWGFVTDGSAWAWVAGTTPTLFGAINANASPVSFGAVPQGGGSPPLAIASGVATLPVSAGGLMIANIATRAWSYVADASWGTAIGPELLIRRVSVGKLGQDGSPFARLSGAAARALTCPR